MEGRDECRDPLAQEVLRERVACDRLLNVRMVIDKSGRDHLAVRVDDRASEVGIDAFSRDQRDTTVRDGYVRPEPISAGSVDHHAADDDEVVRLSLTR